MGGNFIVFGTSNASIRITGSATGTYGIRVIDSNYIVTQTRNWVVNSVSRNYIITLPSRSWIITV
jgi:hypothetical protein